MCLLVHDYQCYSRTEVLIWGHLGLSEVWIVAKLGRGGLPASNGEGPKMSLNVLKYTGQPLTPRIIQ